MISSNPAFDFLRKYKPCEQHTEELVMKKIKWKIKQEELITVFEKGVSGDYGKFIVADAQTLIGWVAQFNKDKNSSQNYLGTSLTPAGFPSWETIDWFREANKCFTAFLNGVTETNFNPAVYDRLMLDNKIVQDSYMKFFKKTENEKGDVMIAKQKVLFNTFSAMKKAGMNYIYVIK